MEAKEKYATPRWQTGIAAGVIFGVVVVTFLGARRGEFLTWDDDINITGNPHLRELTWDNVRWMFTDTAYMRRYVPFAWLNWSLDRAWFGLTAASAHTGNILIHAVNAVLVYLLARTVLTVAWAGRAVARPGIPGLAAAAGALLWAVHPLRVEVVAWASGRIYCQTIFFLLGATLAYFHAVQAAPGSGRRRGWLAAAVGGFTASLLTYPLAMSYVAVLVIVDFFLLRRFRTGAGFWRDEGNRAVWREKLPFVFATVAVAGVTLAARFGAQGMWEPPPTLDEFGAVPRVMRAFYIWAYYGWKPLVPVGLAPVYTTLVWFDPAEFKFVLSAVGVAALTTVLIWQRRHWPGALTVWLCHLVLLVPMLGLTEHPHYANDRYSYLVGIVWAMAVAAVLLSAPQRLAVALAVPAVALLGLMSAAQVQIWHDNETLFRHLLGEISDARYRADLTLRLGDALRSKGNLDEAAANYRESLRLEPSGMRSIYAHLGLGRIARVNGAVEEAAGHFRQSIELWPDIVEPQLELGELLLYSGSAAEAAVVLERAAALAPNHPLVHYHRGIALQRTGHAAEAVAEGEAAVRLAPAFIGARCSLAAALVAAGRPAEAAAQCREALRRAPRAAEAYLQLGDALRATGDWPGAVAALREAVRLRPGWAEAQVALTRLETTAR